MSPRTLRYLVATVGLGVLCLVCCTRADARSPFWRPRPAPPPYSVMLEDENGSSLPTFAKDGRTFLLGEPGLRYNIRVCNPTAQRVEAVISVDGRDAVSGRPGDYVNERGYVVAAYGCQVVEGFRQSFEEVAAFRFTSPQNSYSSRMGTPQNVGVIGVAFFPERVRPPAPLIRRRTPRPAPLPYDSDARKAESSRDQPSWPMRREPAGAAAPSNAPSEGRADSAARSRGTSERYSGPRDLDLGATGSVDNLGTEYGETHQSAVSSVSFERALPSHPALLSTLRYDDADGLIARGIDLSGYGYGPRNDDEPQPFPVSRFAQPPP